MLEPIRSCERHQPFKRGRRPFPPVLAAGLLLGLWAGCRTAPPLAPVDLSAPGWTVRQGQAVWKTSATGPEIAGELLVATQVDGRALIQFSKVPLPLLTAWTEPGHWQIQYTLEKRTAAGPGPPPPNYLWLHLVPALRGLPLPSPLQAEQLPSGQWRIRHLRTGETVTIDLPP